MTSADQGLTHCNQCGECCRLNPCVLVPSDVLRISKKLGVAKHEFVQLERTPEDKWLVRMRRPCRFLVDSKCEIHEFKPTGGMEFECWTPETKQRTYWWSQEDLSMFKD